jgi:hypothetical protein
MTVPSLALLFLFDREIKVSVIVVLFLQDFLRVSIKALKTDKSRALIFLFFGSLYMIFIIPRGLVNLVFNHFYLS